MDLSYVSVAHHYSLRSRSNLYARTDYSVASLTGATVKRALCPDGTHVTANAACCSLFAVRDDLQKNLFNGGQCNDMAHDAFRLTFHDAIAISPAMEAKGQFGYVTSCFVCIRECAHARACV